MGRSRTTGRERATTPPPKVCASCARTIEWRAKWAHSWDDVKYCSTACRRRGVTADDRDLEQMLLEALRARPRASTLSLDDFDRPADAADASAHREQLRRAARRLAARGLVEWLQAGRPVAPSTARGPVALRLVRTPS